MNISFGTAELIEKFFNSIYHLALQAVEKIFNEYNIITVYILRILFLFFFKSSTFKKKC